MHTKESLTRDLEAMGFRHGDNVLMHSSMKAIGDVQGRADTVLDTFMDFFGYEGMLVLPTLTFSNVNDKQPIYDVRTTPSVVGILPQLFRQRPGVIRSLHPTHSVAAYGPYAAAFTEGHERFDTPGARFSPWGRLIPLHAKILFVGASIYHNTFLHAVEEWGNSVDGGLTTTRQNLVVIDYDGRATLLPSRRHQGGHSRYYGCLEPHFRAIGALTEGNFGDAHCVILDAVRIADFVLALLAKYPLAFLLEWVEKHPGFYQNTIPS